MTQFLILAASAPGSGNQFGVMWELLIAQAVSFLILAFLLHRFAYRPVLDLLERRRAKVAESMAGAERIQQQLAATETERKEILHQANQEASRLIEEAREAAARVQQRESQKAVAQAEQIVAQAREAAASDHARMLAELRSEVGRLVVGTTSQVIGRALSDEDQKRLSEEAARSLGASS